MQKRVKRYSPKQGLSFRLMVRLKGLLYLYWSQNVNLQFLYQLMHQFVGFYMGVSLEKNTYHIPFLLVINHFVDSEGLEEPMSFFAQTLNWYSLPGIMLQAVNLLLKMRSATVCHCLLLESRLVTMQCSLSSRFSSGDGVHEMVTVPGTFSSISTGPGGLGSSGGKYNFTLTYSPVHGMEN